MKFGGFHFIHPACTVYVKFEPIPDTETVQVTVMIDQRHTFTGISEVEMFTIGWARQMVFDLVPMHRKLDLFFYGPIMHYKDGKIGPEQLDVQIMERMEHWPDEEKVKVKNEIEIIKKTISK